MFSMGYSGTFDNRTGSKIYLPCPLGTFSKSSGKGKGRCMECPPGMYRMKKIIESCCNHEVQPPK